MEMTTAKTLAVFAIIVGCFAVLYPKIFHPMLLHALGGTPQPHESPGSVPQMPPHLRRPGGAGRGGGPGGDDITHHMRGGGPHPGLRAAAEMKKQAGTPAGSGKGMMSVVLPMYAVGIVIYLIYTMTKVFGKSDSKPQEKDYVASHFKEAEKPKQSAAAMAAAERHDNKRKQKDLERLLMKADKDKITDLFLGSKGQSRKRAGFGLGTFLGPKDDIKNISEYEMQQLKDRLLETEAQMTRILQAMETVTDKVGLGADGEPQAKPSELGDLPERPTQLPDSSPDMDSYEVISKKPSSGEGSPVMVEDIGALDGRRQQQEEEQEEEGEYEDEEEGVMGDTEEERDDEDEEDVEVEYDVSEDEQEQMGQQGSSEEEDETEQDFHPDLRKCQPEQNVELIGQHSTSDEETEQDSRPDLRKRRPPSNQKHKE